MIFYAYLEDDDGETHCYIIDDVKRTKRKAKTFPYPEWVGLPYKSWVSIFTPFFGGPLWSFGLKDITESSASRTPRRPTSPHREFYSKGWTG